MYQWLEQAVPEKSTLLHMLGGLDYATSGKCMLYAREKVNFLKLNEADADNFRRRNIGFIFQNYNLVSMLNVYKNVVLPIRLDGNKPDDEFIGKILSLLGLTEKSRNRPNQLSGGQQQRVAIARALASKPKIVLADEPTGNLDSRTSAEVIGLLQMTNREFNQTIIMITHNEEIAQLADRIIHLEDGRVVGGDIHVSEY